MTGMAAQHLTEWREQQKVLYAEHVAGVLLNPTEPKSGMVRHDYSQI